MLDAIRSFFWEWPITGFSVAVALLIGAAVIWSDVERRTERHRRAKEQQEDDEAEEDECYAGAAVPAGFPET
jgi:cytochrome c-type biogenesis protein CcmH/NrfF